MKLTKILDKFVANHTGSKNLSDLFVFVKENGNNGSFKINEEALGLTGKISPNAVVSNALIQGSGLGNSLNDTTCTVVRDYICSNLNLTRDSLSSFSMKLFEKEIEISCNGNIFNICLGNDKNVIISIENENLYDGTLSSSIETTSRELRENSNLESIKSENAKREEYHHFKKLECFNLLTNSVSRGDSKTVAGYLIAQEYADQTTGVYEGHLTLSQPEKGYYVFASSTPEAYKVDSEGEITPCIDEAFPAETRFHGEPTSEVCDIITQQVADLEDTLITLHNRNETLTAPQDNCLGQ